MCSTRTGANCAAGRSLVEIEPQVFDLLEFIIRNRDRVVSRDDLLEAVWHGRIVSESTLSSRINAARVAVADDGTAQRLIRTLPRKGVRFVGEVRERKAREGAETRSKNIRRQRDPSRQKMRAPMRGKARRPDR